MGSYSSGMEVSIMNLAIHGSSSSGNPPPGHHISSTIKMTGSMSTARGTASVDKLEIIYGLGTTRTYLHTINVSAFAAQEIICNTHVLPTPPHYADNAFVSICTDHVNRTCCRIKLRKVKCYRYIIIYTCGYNRT